MVSCSLVEEFERAEESKGSESSEVNSCKYSIDPPVGKIVTRNFVAIECIASEEPSDVVESVVVLAITNEGCRKK
jgi:hypothetical protein